MPKCPKCGKVLELKSDFIGWWAECVCGYEDWICPIKVSRTTAHRMFLTQEFTLPEVSSIDMNGCPPSTKSTGVSHPEDRK